MKVVKIYSAIYFFILIFFLELVYKISVFNNFFNISLLYMLLFTIAIAFLLGVLTSLFSPKVNRILIWILTGLLTFIFLAQYIYISVYLTPFSFNQLVLANQAFDYVDIIVEYLLGNILIVVLMVLPIILFIIFKKKIIFMNMDKRRKFIFLGFFVLMQFIANLSLMPGKDKLYSSYNLYHKVDALNQIIERFGLMSGMRIDLQRMIFKFEEDILIDIPKLPDEILPPEIKYNITDIDFEGLALEEKDATLKQMHQYFSGQAATKQNEYSGIFKEKNLIFIVAEAFSGFVIDKELTPTLYKMANSSFVFDNYYNPVILSTIGGEMQALMGLVPSMDTINLWPVKKPLFPYAIGNAFSNIGYQANAYHNWTYTYYKRDLTRPTLGFNNYMGCGNGLEKLMNCKQWPTSDMDLVEAIAPMIIGTDRKQATYILTVSGHTPWSWGASAMARKNRSLVEGLSYSETVKAYIASNIELDRALELLVKKLEEADELDDTVIALVGDHYPYNLSLEEMEEMSKKPLDKIIEINRSNFILWNANMETVHVKKIGGQIDALPTLLNLFGIEYDSRLIIGKDILSDEPGLVMFGNREWISDLGRFMDRKFTPNEGVDIPDDYAADMNKIVANKFSMSKLLMQKNYYQKVLGR